MFQVFRLKHSYVGSAIFDEKKTQDNDNCRANCDFVIHPNLNIFFGLYPVFSHTNHIFVIVVFCLALTFFVDVPSPSYVLCQIEIYKSFSISISFCFHFQL